MNNTERIKKKLIQMTQDGWDKKESDIRENFKSGSVRSSYTERHAGMKNRTGRDINQRLVPIIQSTISPIYVTYTNSEECFWIRQTDRMTKGPLTKTDGQKSIYGQKVKNLTTEETPL